MRTNSSYLIVINYYYIISARLPQFSPYDHGYTRFCHQPLQQVQNSAARHILIWHPVVTTPHHSCEKVRRLLITERIKYEVACMCFHATSGSGANSDVSELVRVYVLCPIGFATLRILS